MPANARRRHVSLAKRHAKRPRKSRSRRLSAMALIYMASRNGRRRRLPDQYTSSRRNRTSESWRGKKERSGCRVRDFSNVSIPAMQNPFRQKRFLEFQLPQANRVSFVLILRPSRIIHFHTRERSLRESLTLIIYVIFGKFKNSSKFEILKSERGARLSVRLTANTFEEFSF